MLILTEYLTAVGEEEKTVVSNKLNNTFSKVSTIFSKESAAEVSTKDVFLMASNYDVLTRALDLGQIPKDLQFFPRGKSKEFGERLYSLGLRNSSIKFAEFLMSGECRMLLWRNKISFDIEIGNIFFDNTNCIEMKNDFFFAQLDCSKKLLKMRYVFII